MREIEQDDFVATTSNSSTETQLEQYSTALISVIIPVLEEEKLLPLTLELFTDERKKLYNVEVIVSDGGSKDATVEIAKQYADIVVVHKELRKQRISEGRNLGAEKATGDILVFLNGDTIIANPDLFFEEIVKWSKGNGSLRPCDALAFPVKISPSESRLSDKLFHSFFNVYLHFLNKIGLGMGRGECQVVKAKIFKKVGGYNPKVAAGEDFDLMHRISKIGTVGFAKNILVYESPRRFRKFGYSRIIFTWFTNWLSVLVFGKSTSEEWEAVR
jgi:glycosyltransferase involved in cell wall biosynthesis